MSSVPASEPGHNEPDSSALVYLLDMLSVTPEQQEQQMSKIRLPKSMRKLHRLQRQQQVNKKPFPPPGLNAIAPPPGLHRLQRQQQVN